MASQIYLLLIRNPGKWPDTLTAGSVAGGALLVLKTLMKDMIRGDSLDVPFVKFIRVRTVSHAIKYTEKRNQSERNAMDDSATSSVKDKDAYKTASDQTTFFGNFPGSSIQSSLEDFWSGHAFDSLTLPEQSEFKFTKLIDNATPQLAYGCSAQEAFPLAVFFFRRKIGLGVEGIRTPYFVVGLYKCMITGWELDGENEKVSMKYSSIAWCSIDPLADSNLPVGFSQRYFDIDSSSGGEVGWAALLQLLSQGLALAAGGVLMATGKADGSVTNGP